MFSQRKRATDKDLAAWFQDTVQLGQNFREIEYMLKDLAAEYRIETCIMKWQCVTIVENIRESFIIGRTITVVFHADIFINIEQGPVWLQPTAQVHQFSLQLRCEFFESFEQTSADKIQMMGKGRIEGGGYALLHGRSAHYRVKLGKISRLNLVWYFCAPRAGSRLRMSMRLP